MTDLNVDIIGYDCGWGCRDYGCEDGPYALPADQILQYLAAEGINAKYHQPLGLKFLGDHKKLTKKEDTLPLVTTGLQRLSQKVRETVEKGSVPVVIGGDHSSAIGTWSGTIAAKQAHEKFGLIWLDAHLDSHTYETSWQGKWGGWWHGQPVSALLGFGLPEFVSIGGPGKKLSAQHISIIGPHNFEPAEEEFVRKHGIRVYLLNEVRQRGFKAVFEESLARATNGTSGFGMTIDLDAFDPKEAPGVGSAEDQGLQANEVLPIIKSTGRHPLFRALEVAEFNPHNDKDGKTAHLAENLIKAVFSKVY